jgi:hypothetical protein
MSTDRGAHLRFRGQWLVEAGFLPGATVEVNPISPGRMELRVVSPNRAPDPQYLDAIAALTRVLV